MVIVEHNLDLVLALALALADRVFALERGAVFHKDRPGSCSPTSNTASKILWL